MSNLHKHVNEHEENVVIIMITDDIRQANFDIYVHK